MEVKKIIKKNKNKNNKQPPMTPITEEEIATGIEWMPKEELGQNTILQAVIHRKQTQVLRIS